MKIKRILIITLITTILIFTIDVLGGFTFLENKTYDFRTKKTASNSTSDDIFVILIDQNSLDWASSQMNWSWPWPRSAYGDIINFFNLSNPKSIAFDVIFSEPSIYGNEDDEYFANASKNFGKVVQIQFYDSASNSPDIPLCSIPKISNQSAMLGNVNSLPDSDSIIRRAKLFYNNEDEEIPSLASSAFITGSKNFDKELYKETNEYKLLKNIKTDKDGSVLLKYKSGLNAYIPYSASDILKSYYAIQNGEEPILTPEDFSDAYIFFGYFAPGLYDICATPLSSSYPGVGVHVTLLDNILQNDFIIKSSNVFNFVLIILFSFLTCFFIHFAEKKLTIKKTIFLCSSFILLLIIIYTIICFITFSFGLWLPFVNILFAILTSFTISFFVHYNSEGKQKRFIKEAFKQYLSPVVIEQLITNPSKLKLGGEKREISIFFSDIQGFTSISESLSPEQLTEFLNIYLSKMTDIILESGGTIDKYEGDAIIAFWNAPTNLTNHAQIAIETAIKCQNELNNIQKELKKFTNIKIKNRIGINTGFAVVGNMGSSKRFDYTMLGDSVNLASRLEGINKQFGLYTLCSEETKNQAIKTGCNLKFIEIAKVKVVGKNQAVTVFTAMNNKTFEKEKNFWNKFEEGRNLFYQGKIEEAKICFNSISENFILAQKYLQKCENTTLPIEENLKGLWIATEK